MSIQKYPCVDCEDCYAIREGQGICDYNTFNKHPEDKIIVDLFAMYPHCPKPKGAKK